MMLNRLLGSLIGSVRNSDPKLVELKVGQIVSGTVLRMLAEQEALVNIGGTTVHAKLEAPLRQGQRTLLQVQPESTGSTIVLKPLQSSHTRIAESSLGELLASFRVKDTEAHRQLLQQLHAAGIPIDRSTFRLFQQITAARPAAVPEQQWFEAAVAAHRKGLPMTGETVASLRQALFGGSLTALLGGLEEALARFVSDGAARQNGAQAAVETARKLQEAIRLALQQAPVQDGARASELQGAARPQAPAAPAEGGLPAISGRSPAPGTAASPSGAPGEAIAGEAGGMAKMSRGGAATAESAARPQAEPAPSAGRNAAAEAAPAARAAAPVSAAPPEALREAAPGRQEPPPSGNPGETRAAQPEQQGGPRFGQAQSNAADARSVNWLHALMKHIGLDHEHRIAEQLLTPQREAAVSDYAARPENVKALLLALAADADHLPQSLKDQVQQTLQQITGQQLLLGSERGTPFTTITLFIPVPQEGGADTATVHVQTRKKQEGGLDPDNCRLLFDLRMKAMGDTLIDVQVVDRIVSLQVFNDHAATGELLAAYKSEIQDGLAAIGYQCISLKHAPFPDKETDGSAAAASGTKAVPVPAATELYASRPYRGVDIRV